MAWVKVVARAAVVALVVLGMAVQGHAATPARHRGASSVLRTVAVDKDPILVVVDARSSRAFVACVRIPIRGNPSGSVSVLDSRSGALLRTVSMRGAPDMVALAVDERTRHVFVVSKGLLGQSRRGTGTVSMLDAKTGAVLRTISVGKNAVAVAVDERLSRAFVVSEGAINNNGKPAGSGTVTMLDTRTGTVLHSSTVGIGTQGVVADARTDRVFALNSYDATVSVLDAHTGSIQRTVALRPGTFPITGLVDERAGRALIVNGAGTVSVLDAHTGAVRRTISLRPFTYLPPAGAVDSLTGRAFIANHSRGTVTVLDTRTGAVLRTVAVGQGPIALAVDERIGRIVVVNRGSLAGLQAVTGAVSVLDAATGRVIRTQRVGAGPQAIALDVRHGRAVIANTGDDTVSVLRLSR